MVEQLRGAEGNVSPSDLAGLLGTQDDAPFERRLNAALVAHLDGDPAPLERLAAEYEGSGGSAPPPVDISPQLSYICGDGAHPFERGATREERRGQLDAYYERERPHEPFTAEPPRRPWTRSAEWTRRVVRQLAHARGDPRRGHRRHGLRRAGVRRRGGLDHTSLPRWGAEVAEDFPNSTFVEMPHVGASPDRR